MSVIIERIYVCHLCSQVGDIKEIGGQYEEKECDNKKCDHILVQKKNGHLTEQSSKCSIFVKNEMYNEAIKSLLNHLDRNKKVELDFPKNDQLLFKKKGHYDKWELILNNYNKENAKKYDSIFDLLKGLRKKKLSNSEIARRVGTVTQTVINVLRRIDKIETEKKAA